ncbi:succinate--CoA ligase [GDP-forming] subunit beta, mitochondrial [Ischnura elegans]|uniref:succinate--CoA ligase [GDP-forming] subunit beta, mitochondrial n=1 Tax=Ischnura elegans TaxID=197161 RepID=UPI001ED89367|nr:succinate--CoA ligase [GDP-forming] subunit beta, mitochondrial [Ischnura elegans]XP_046405517.1 succinate--CoA ligase [GDP-forming] subunit beta, mitochondrial [Ischnura elegans]XP_046405519.1 succinate--CoA ligase [GDP-forming] subunit beta, mitochondrial [Ischnura elegans]XP_046405520.1 succinate--CoA ligase [GDP-forming] subunit beta, mitochondrial [Ischnura elegans]
MAAMRTVLSRRPLRLSYDSTLGQVFQVRHLNLFEYQSKVLLSNNGVNVQKFKILDSPSDANSLQSSFKADEYVIKAQILAGGRGLGHFDNGFKGGVHITKDPTAVGPIVSKMIGHNLITKQTPKEGIPVKKVMVAESVTIMKEKYLCYLMDRQSSGPVLIASPAGGTDIEEVAKKTPHLIRTIPIDIIEGVTDKMAESVAEFLEFAGDTKTKAAHEIKKLWGFFKKVDSIQLEINPLAETSTGDVVSIDAKIQFDDNARYRQKDIFDLEDKAESDPREVIAEKYNLNYIGMSGNIGCMVNGAGLAMATMDIINLYGGSPANFLDVGGGVKEEQVYQAFSLLNSDKNVKAILVNVFGGIVNCATIANGIVAACKDMKLEIPLVVRLEGTNVTEAKKILNSSGLPIQSASNLDEAAKKAVGALS